MKTLIRELEKIAGKEGYRVRAEAVSNSITCHYGKLYPEAKLIQIYYENQFERLIVTAHEVGHAKTTDQSQYGKRQYYYEKLASRWALDFLDRGGLSGELLAEAKKFYAVCLESYK